MQVPCVNLKKKCTPLSDNCKDGTLHCLLFITEGARGGGGGGGGGLALSDIS